MFFVNNSEKVTIRTYRDLVNQFVEYHDEAYKSLIDKIILETNRVSIDNGNGLNEVDSGIFYIVSRLYNFNKDYFARLDLTGSINAEVYKDLNIFLSTLAQTEL
jgi:hypothetical protein